MVEHQNISHHQSAVNDRSLFGFWIYLMTDLLMFAVLFAVYAVLHERTVGGEAGHELFSLPTALASTVILLTSSFTSGIGMIYARRGDKTQTFLWFGLTALLGLVFLSLELNEFAELFREGYTPRTNAFMSSFFVLVGAHGLHIFFGLLWLVINLVFIAKRGLNVHLIRKLDMLSLYWHFLDIVWVFIFTIVYLGAFV